MTIGQIAAPGPVDPITLGSITGQYGTYALAQTPPPSFSPTENAIRDESARVSRLALVPSLSLGRFVDTFA